MGFGDDEEQPDPDAYPQGIDLQSAASARARLARRIPGLSDSYYRGGWSGLFTTTPDWHPILDSVPGVKGLFCAVGFSGHGFKLSPAIGKAVAELVAEGKARDVDLSPLRFSRFAEGDLMESSYRYRVLALGDFMAPVSDFLVPGGIYEGDARALLSQVRPESVALSFWSPALLRRQILRDGPGF